MLGRGRPAPYWGFRVVGVPYWLVMAGTAVWPGVWVMRRVGMKRGPGFCERCGYDLRATPERCTECGTLHPQ